MKRCLSVRRHVGGRELVNRPGLQPLYVWGARRSGVRGDALANDGKSGDEITEFIAGMTDRYALDYARNL